MRKMVGQNLKESEEGWKQYKRVLVEFRWNSKYFGKVLPPVCEGGHPGWTTYMWIHGQPES